MPDGSALIEGCEVEIGDAIDLAMDQLDLAIRRWTETATASPIEAEQYASRIYDAAAKMTVEAHAIRWRADRARGEAMSKQYPWMTSQ